MLDILKKGVFTGLGMISLTKDKVESLAKKLAEESKLSEEEGRKLVNEILSQSEEEKKKIEAKVEEIVASTLKKLDIPSREKMENLTKRIEELERKVGGE